MIEIQIAGAGAGKTFGLADKITNHINNYKGHKKIFVLTYTNSATTKIQQEIIKKIRNIPSILHIQTVHSFLLNEIVYPYSSYILDDVYNNISIMKISTSRFKNLIFKELKKNKIIHADNVYRISKKIIDKKNHTKLKKEKIRKIISILSDCFEKIYIDEVQDLNMDALSFFEILGKNNICIYMIGDPKQAIKWPNDLVDFISRIKNENYTNILPINNVSRRIPKQILEQSNRFCYQDQYQTSSSIITGELQYLESNHPDYDNIINNFITKNQIVCIDKKQGRYLTNYINKYSFPYEIEELIKNSKHGRDANLILKAAYADFCYDASCNNKKNTITINNLIRRFSLRLNSRQYAQLYELYDYHNNQVNTSFRISSIDAVKGLEANICALILSPNLLKYFLVIDLKKNQFFNKEWKKIYVALTRPKKKMVLVIEHELLANYNLKEIKQKIKNFGFTCFKQNDADFT